MLPPPRTTSSTGSSVRAQIVSLVRYAASARPGTGGTAGDAPVARTARRKVIVRPSTSTVDGPVNLASPVRTLTPSRARACGESTGAIRLAAAWTWAITAGRSTRTPSTWTPNRCAVRAAAADRAAARIAFDGTHPVHRQSPPGRSRSTSRTLAPTPWRPSWRPRPRRCRHRPRPGPTACLAAPAGSREVLVRDAPDELAQPGDHVAVGDRPAWPQRQCAVQRPVLGGGLGALLTDGEMRLQTGDLARGPGGPPGRRRGDAGSAEQTSGRSSSAASTASSPASWVENGRTEPAADAVSRWAGDD
jgi:hypothetical protein